MRGTWIASFIVLGIASLACAEPCIVPGDRAPYFDWKETRPAPGERVFEAFINASDPPYHRIVCRDGRKAEVTQLVSGSPASSTFFEYKSSGAYTRRTMAFRQEGDGPESIEEFTAPWPALPVSRSLFSFNPQTGQYILGQQDRMLEGTRFVQERRIFRWNGTLSRVATFGYESAPYELNEYGDNTRLASMIVKSPEGEILMDLDETRSWDLGAILARASASEIERRLRIFDDTTRAPVAVFDTGIDAFHPEIAYRMWNNPREPKSMGLHQNPALRLPIEDLTLKPTGIPKVGHGTLIADVATRGLEERFALVGFANMLEPQPQAFVKEIINYLNRNRVRFANVSLGIDRAMLSPAEYEGTSLPSSVEMIGEIIAKTPDTLYAVAAGNGHPFTGLGKNNDTMTQVYPAGFEYDNMIVVGSINSAVIEEAALPRYERSNFSNFGEVSVDILAPGENLCGARSGGGEDCLTGTSFATPYLLNHGVLRLAQANEALTPGQIKEILLKTAYIRDLEQPEPVRSGGILFPRRALAVASLLKAEPALSVREAALAIRSAAAFLAPGERNDPATLEKLTVLWQARNL